MAKRSGRPPNAVDPNASHAARLGAELRALRHARGLTLQALGEVIGYSSQHLSCAERAESPVSGRFVAACDRALDAEGSLLELLPDVVGERLMRSYERAAARRLAAGGAATMKTWIRPAVAPFLVPAPQLH